MREFLLFLCVFLSPLATYAKCHNPIVARDIQKIQYELALELRREFGFAYAGGYSFNDVAAMDLEIHTRASLEEARHLVVYIAQRLIEKIETDERTRPYLGKCLSLPLNVSVRIAFYNTIDQEQCDGSIAHVSLGRSKIHYRAEDPLFPHYKNDYEESYEEAKHLVAATRPLKPSLHQNTPLEVAFDKLIPQYATHVVENHRLFVGDLGREPGNQLGRVSVRMSYHSKTQIEGARLLIVKAVEQLVAMIRANVGLQSPTFSADQIRMRINFKDNHSCPFSNDSLEKVELIDGNVTYFELDHEIDPLHVFTESYTQAKEEADRKISKKNWRRCGN